MNSASGGLRQRSIGLLAAVALIVPLLATGASAQTERQPWEGLDNVGNGNAAPVGAGFTLTAQDVEFILDQIRISEAHVQTSTPGNPCGTLVGPDPLTQIPAGDLTQPFGLRVLDGSCNNLVPGNEQWGASDQPFIQLIPKSFDAAEDLTSPFAPPPDNVLGNPTTYADLNPNKWVEDSQPRVISNLVADQTLNNPAAIAAGGVDEGNTTLNIENVAPDLGLSAPTNDMLTFFGQFFDHGLDLTTKNGAPVYMPLKADDPLFVPGGNNFMVLSRSQDGTDPINLTTPYVDQNQTYTSHPSHQVFLRDYVPVGGGAPGSTGFLLETDGGMSTWETLKTQAGAELGIRLEDHDVHNVPLLATDQYGNFIPGMNGFPQIVSPGSPGGLLEGAPGVDGLGVALPADTMRTGHGFILDFAHHANPGTCGTGAPGDPVIPQTADIDSLTIDDNDPCTYDDETLDAHFIAGDGRANENHALTAVHHVFHAEHNRLVTDIMAVATAGGPALAAEFTGVRAPGEFSNGERLFQAAKLVTEMEYQHLAFEEFARTISPLVQVFDAYDTSINSAIAAEFAHSVYRFGHSMLNENVARFDADGTDNSTTLINAFVNPVDWRKDSNGVIQSPDEAAGSLWRGGVTQVGQEIDEFVVDALRNSLLGLPLDLPAINLARGRDNGIAKLNAVREHFYANGLRPNLEPYNNWAEFKFELKTSDSIVNFVAAYGTHLDLDLDPDGLGPIVAGSAEGRRGMADIFVNGLPGDPGYPADAAAFLGGTGAYAADKGGLDNVDLWMGGLAEKRELDSGSMLGITFDFMFREQMEKLQSGDRFYYLHRMGGTNMLTQLEGNSLSEMVQRNTTAMGLPANVFSRPDFTFDLNKQDQDPINQPAPIMDDSATGYLEPELLERQADGTIRFWPGSITGGALAAGVLGDEHTNWIGSELPDLIHAGDGDDTIRGNGGDDRIEGDGGGDNIIGGEGDDIITDSSGDDDIKSGPGDDAISGGPGINLLQGGPGDDYVLSGQDDGNETLAGPGDDILIGGVSADAFVAGEGDDWVEGGGGSDGVEADDANPLDISPDGGNDVMNGQGGDDRMEGEGGDDIFFQSAGLNRIEGILGFDWQVQSNAADLNNTIGLGPPFQEDRFFQVEGLSGTSGDDQLNGDDAQGALAAGTQTIDADSLALIAGLADVLPVGATMFEDGNVILGGAGSDLLMGRGQDDVIDGDVYLDVYLIHNPPGGPVVRYDSALLMQADIFAGIIDPGHIDIVREIVDPGAGADIDVAIFQGNMAEYDISFAGDRVIVNHIAPNPLAIPLVDDGVDTLRNIETLRFLDQDVPVVVAPLCNGLVPTIDLNVTPGALATAGNDVILGTPLGETILGAGGDDTICGGGGDDIINGELGSDTIFGEAGNDTIFGDAGNQGPLNNDVVDGGEGDDMIFTFEGNDTIVGGAGIDTMNGGLNDDMMNGNAGNDIMNGGGGIDTMFGDEGNDRVLGDNGADIIDGGIGNDLVNGGADNDIVLGGDGDDSVFGFTGDDINVDGGAGNDFITGGAGNDGIETGSGDDQAFGNEGNDVMTAVSGTNVINAGPGDDNITGGTGADTIFGDGALIQAGNDTIDGGAGQDSLFGLAGDDNITANDGELDTVFGQQGIDNCLVDGGLATPNETVVGGCETEIP